VSENFDSYSDFYPGLLYLVDVFKSLRHSDFKLSYSDIYEMVVQHVTKIDLSTFVTALKIEI